MGNPGEQFQGALHVRGGDGTGVLRDGFFQRSLGQVIEEPGQAIGRVDQQVQSGGVERVGVNAGVLQARLM